MLGGTDLWKHHFKPLLNKNFLKKLIIYLGENIILIRLLVQRSDKMSNKNEVIKSTNVEVVNIENIYQDIRNKIINARTKMYKHIDTTMTEVYWYVGKITYGLSENSTKASYGKKIIDVLSSKLTVEFGSGFSSVSIRRMRKFYEYYSIWSAVPTELSWSHFQELIKVDRKEEREFYQIESIKSNWAIENLEDKLIQNYTIDT